jgi:hypothetical protein
MHNPFRCFNSSPEVIRLTVMMYVRFPLSLRQVEDLLYERGDHIDKNYAPEARAQSVVLSLDDGEESYWGEVARFLRRKFIDGNAGSRTIG